jgi:two-component system, cell cycle sensor histidine kinase and response regulator CckA
MADDPALSRPAHGPSAQVLVVDDERVVRRALQRILERDGHTVLVAEGGREALEIYRQRWQEVSAVVLDVMMPDMDGREVLGRMRELNPGVRAILSSGFTVDADPTLTSSGAVLLQKPYTPDHVRAAVAEALSSK